MRVVFGRPRKCFTNFILGCFPMLRTYPELTLDKWAQKYGPIYSVSLGNQLFVIVSDPGVAKELMITNGAIFSDRKPTLIKSETILVGRGITANRYDHQWRKHRRIAAIWLKQQSVERYTDTLDYEATDMIYQLCMDSKNGRHINPQPYAGRCALNNMAKITFGFRTDNIYHPFVKQALALSREFMNTTGPMSNLVDFMPRWVQKSLPWKMKRCGKRLHTGLLETYGGRIKDVEMRLKEGVQVQDCLAKTMITIKDEEKLDDLDMTMLASAFMIGGVETTASVMQWFSALIPAHPSIQRKAHEELDRIVGRNRLPTIQDEVKLPYCRSIIKEVARCHNPFWLGTSHVASEDFVYKGATIPKGTVVVLNTWSLHHDPKRWIEPLEFNPDRYINDNDSASTSARRPDVYTRDHWMFGIGRRMCPGMFVAEREIWLVVSRMLWAFEMFEIPEKPVDLKEYDGMSGQSPVPFEIVLRPRFEGVEEILAGELSRTQV
ncbi:cytochrome P450 [Clathrospora elynae]|uniref:Cytochrome P450 n=1 Tax=Clathrospora elynae TaxID=706981 RepID=A0A6A5SC68_9PLEO|nr:cytochrome P450 [Clathrospora elynae]